MTPDLPLTRLRALGIEALADAELLACLGLPIDRAREALATYGSLAALAGQDVDALRQVPGIRDRAAARLSAAFEIQRRVRARVPGQHMIFSAPNAVAEAFGPLMEHLDHEEFRIVMLDAQNGLIRDRVISRGTLSASLVHPREVFKPAILASAASLILLHNHPSGDPTPSREDIRLTRGLVEAARLLDLQINDHVIIGRGAHVSLATEGIL